MQSWGVEEDAKRMGELALILILLCITIAISCASNKFMYKFGQTVHQCLTASLEIITQLWLENSSNPFEVPWIFTNKRYNH